MTGRARRPADPGLPGSMVTRSSARTWNRAPRVWLPSVQLNHSDGPKVYPCSDSAAASAWLGQVSALQLHVPQRRIADHGRSGCRVVGSEGVRTAKPTVSSQIARESVRLVRASRLRPGATRPS